MASCSLLSLATAVPPHVVEQSAAKEIGRRAFRGKAALFDRLSGVFDNAGIDRRHLVAPLDWYEQAHGWAERNALYLEAADAAVRASGAQAAIAERRPDVRPTSTASSPFRPPVSPPRASKPASVRGSVFAPTSAASRCSASAAPAGSAAWRSPARLAGRRARNQLAVRHRRDLLDLDPPRQRRSRGDRRHRLVRRRRGGGGRPAPGTAASRSSAGRPRNCGPTRSGSWAGGSRTRASA